MSLLQEVENRTKNTTETIEENEGSEFSNNSHKRVKINESFEFQDSPSVSSKLEDNHCEKENMARSFWMKASKFKNSTDEKVILKDNKSSVNKRIMDSYAEGDSIDRMESSSNKLSKPSFPLSPIDSQNIKLPSNVFIKDAEPQTKQVSVKKEAGGNEDSDRLHSLMEHSFNEMESSLHAPSHFEDPKEEAKEGTYSNVLSS